MKEEQHFFDEMAAKWDEIRNADPAKISRLVGMIGLRLGGRVLDVGCGTGILVPYVKEIVGDAGLITGVDFSANMIALAGQKHKDGPGIRFIAADIMVFQPDDDFDKIICFNFFPHVEEKPAFLARMQELLAAGGCLVIMHDMSRDEVNAIHAGAVAVQNDRLPEGERVAQLLTAAGFRIVDVIDDSEMYFVRGFKD